MSTAPPSGDRDTAPIRIGERKRAALVLGVLAVVAVGLVLIMVYAFGGSGGDKTPAPVGEPTGPAVIATGQASSQSAPSSANRPSTTKPKTTPATAQPRHHGTVSCPTKQPCALADDVGNAVQALNRYRASHGREPVSGSVTKAARVCALSSGDDCPSDFYWEPVGRSGAQVISKIAASGKGPNWLLDKTMAAVEVGWAYLPSSHSFECALVAKH